MNKLHPKDVDECIRKQILECGDANIVTAWTYDTDDTGEVISIGLCIYDFNHPDVWWMKESETLESEYDDVYMYNVPFDKIIKKVIELNPYYEGYKLYVNAWKKEKFDSLTATGDYTSLLWKPIHKNVLIGHQNPVIELKELLPYSHYKLIKKFESDGLHPNIASTLEVLSTYENPLWTDVYVELNCEYIFKRSELMHAFAEHCAHEINDDIEEISTAYMLRCLMDSRYVDEDDNHLYNSDYYCDRKINIEWSKEMHEKYMETFGLKEVEQHTLHFS